MPLPSQFARASSAPGAEMPGVSSVSLSAHATRTAVRFGARSLTYADLDARADRLARRLLRLGVTPKDRVAIAVGRSLRLPVAVLAVLKTGAAYVPIDTEGCRPACVSFLMSD